MTRGIASFAFGNRTISAKGAVFDIDVEDSGLPFGSAGVGFSVVRLLGGGFGIFKILGTRSLSGRLLDALNLYEVVRTFDTVHSVLRLCFSSASKCFRGFQERTCREAEMLRRAKKNTILVASRDPALTHARKQVLEEAGYRVIAIETTEEVARNCERHQIDLVIIGSSLSPAEKRKFWAESRSICKTPILELFGSGPPELMDETHLNVHGSHTATHFLNAVEHILRNK